MARRFLCPRQFVTDEIGTKTRIERLFTSIRSRILDSSFIYLAIDIDPLLLTMQDVAQIWRSKWDTCPCWELRILQFKTLYSPLLSSFDSFLTFSSCIVNTRDWTSLCAFLRRSSFLNFAHWISSIYMYISATSVICCNRGKRNNEKYEVISLEIWTKKGEKESKGR